MLNRNYLKTCLHYKRTINRYLTIKRRKGNYPLRLIYYL
nr:MAG TPA: hypothetical protein [Microviridae sp.]